MKTLSEYRQEVETLFEEKMKDFPIPVKPTPKAYAHQSPRFDVLCGEKIEITVDKIERFVRPKSRVVVHFLLTTPSGGWKKKRRRLQWTPEIPFPYDALKNKVEELIPFARDYREKKEAADKEKSRQAVARMENSNALLNYQETLKKEKRMAELEAFHEKRFDPTHGGIRVRLEGLTIEDVEAIVRVLARK